MLIRETVKKCGVNVDDKDEYDIRLFFQGETNGRMNNTSTDEKYNSLMAELRSNQKNLAKKIAIKVYEHEFLK